MPLLLLGSSSLDYLVSPPVLAGVLAMLLLAGALVYLRTQLRATPPPPPPQVDISEDEPTMPIVPAPVRLPHMPAEAERATESDIDLRGVVSTPLTEEIPVPTQADASELETKSPLSAATLWLRRGDLPAALRCFRTARMPLECARLCRAMGDSAESVRHFREALAAAPTDEAVRLELAEALLDARGHDAEVRDLEDAVTGEASPANAGARFFEKLGALYEAAGSERDALRAYERALARNDALANVLIRQRYLREMERLQLDRPAAPTSGESPEQIMMKMLDSSADIRRLGGGDFAQVFEGYELIVGHTALGKAAPATEPSVRSPFNRAALFTLDRVISHREDSVTFAAVDHLIDVPVLLRLIAIPEEMRRRQEELVQRLRQIARLNHPHLAKLLYAERCGRVLRVVVEYLPGGNLRDYLVKMNAIGIPLLLRLVIQVCHGLEAIHRHNLLHGNLKLDNVLNGADQRVKISDFALLTVTAPADDETDPSAALGLPTRARGFQPDLAAFAEMLAEIMALATERRMPPMPPGSALTSEEAVAEIQGLIEALRHGEFDSAGRIGAALESLLQRALSTGHPTPSLLPPTAKE